ncbi:MAG: Dihydrofolate synthase/folylpolyglutamate synthase [Gammaproteobacteria bacterium]|nr:Dihydrofolate synthase/folylpolyglutamate synthase [Gammaproteobacteria bacterium]
MTPTHALSPIGTSPRFTTLREWLSWQESLHAKEIELGLDRCRAVAERMQVLQPRYATVSVAGTNGKGSSVAMLDSILGAAGYRVGRYTSPHLIRYNERIRVAGEIVDDATICAAFDRIDRARGEISLTYFEFGTLAALDIFMRAGIDVAILEVGMGGRLDAVNLVDADVALIAAIDIDHVDFLGSDRESIGREKAGIMRARRPAVCSDPSPPNSLIEHARGLGAVLHVLGEEYGYEVGEKSWSWRGTGRVMKDLPPPHLHGAFQFQNAAGVLRVIEALAPRCPVSRHAIDTGLRNVQLAGRYQVYPGEVSWILDVAHNPQSARMLAESLRNEHRCNGRTHFLVGMLKDKDIGGVFSVLHDLADEWHLVTLAARRGATAAALSEQLPTHSGRVPMHLHDSIPEAYEAISAAVSPGDRVLVFGSFLTVAGVADILERAGRASD